MRRLFVPLAVAAAVLLANACTPSAPTSIIPVSSPSTPSPSATSLDPATQDLRGAEQAVVALVAKIDALAQDPNLDIGSLDEVARGQAFTTQLEILKKYRLSGWKQLGSQKVLVPSAVLATATTWTVSACIDVSGADVVDASGTSVVDRTKPSRFQLQYGVVRDGAKFYVNRSEVTGSC